MISFKNLFHSKPQSGDGLTQGQREAIIDLLNYCSFVGHEIADSEEQFIDSLEYKLDWDHRMDFDYYVNKSVGIVRGTIDDQEAVGDFLQEIRARLDSPRSREVARDLSDKLFNSAGPLTPAKSEAAGAIRRALAD